MEAIALPMATVTPEEILNRYHPQFLDTYWVPGDLESWNPPCRPALDREEGGLGKERNPCPNESSIGVAWQPYGPPSRQGYRPFLEQTNPNHRLGVIA